MASDTNEVLSLPKKPEGPAKAPEANEYTHATAVSNLIGDALNSFECGAAGEEEVKETIRGYEFMLPEGLVFLSGTFQRGPIFAILKTPDGKFQSTSDDSLATLSEDSLVSILTKRGFFELQSGRHEAALESSEKRKPFSTIFSEFNELAVTTFVEFNRLDNVLKDEDKLFHTLNALQNELNGVLVVGEKMNPKEIIKLVGQVRLLFPDGVSRQLEMKAEQFLKAVKEKFPLPESTKPPTEDAEVGGEAPPDSLALYNEDKAYYKAAEVHFKELAINYGEKLEQLYAQKLAPAVFAARAKALRAQFDKEKTGDKLAEKAKGIFGGWGEKLGNALESLLGALRMFGSAKWATGELDKLKEAPETPEEKVAREKAFAQIALNKTKLQTDPDKVTENYDSTAGYIAEMLGITVNGATGLFNGLDKSGKYVYTRSFSQSLPVGTVLFFSDNKDGDKDETPKGLRTAIVVRSSTLGQAQIRFINSDKKPQNTEIGAHGDYELKDLIGALYNPADLKKEEDEAANLTASGKASDAAEPTIDSET